jgi:alginate O-acetyltransferase complex protein AlgI
MIFTQYWFLEFAAIVVPVYWLLRNPMLRMLFLLVACVVFHAHFAGAAGVLPVVVLGVIVFFIGRSENPTACAAGIALCAFALAFYKYADFFCEGLIAHFSPALAAKMAGVYHKHIPGIPLAISFFTFEFVHYLYEVRRKRPPIRKPLDFALFTIFFPSLVAGPIKRYDEFLASLKRGLSEVNVADVTEGLVRIATGYFKKTCIADNLTSYVNLYVPVFHALSKPERWQIFIAIAFRILMDFSGYSDIAIGFAKLFGIRLPENFNWPYLATSIQIFWQRWHISLSTWIRDYIYIPLGGSRAGVFRRVMNGLIAFALCGLWHGPAWHYVLWGVYHGVGLAICANYRKAGRVGALIGAAFTRAPVLGWAVTMYFVCFGWLLFFYPAGQACRMAVDLAPDPVAIVLLPEPAFDVTTFNFDPAISQTDLDRLKTFDFALDGWVSGKGLFKVPRVPQCREVEIAVDLPPDAKPSTINVFVSDRAVAAHPIGIGTTKFVIPLPASDLPPWLVSRLRLRNRVELRCPDKFTLPDGRTVSFRVLSMTFR